MQEVLAEFVKFLPDNDWLKLLFLMFLLLVAFLRERLLTGSLACLRYMYRWFRRQMIEKHYWLMQSGYLDRDNWTYGTFNYRCLECGKYDSGPGIL